MMAEQRAEPVVHSTVTPQETFALANHLAERCQPGDCIALIGDLGVGKTVFAKGFAAGLGITEPITSPTFTIVCEYATGRLPLYHFDVYRIETADELFEIGFDEYLYGDGVCLIEWADRIMDELPPRTLVVHMEREPAAGTDARRITMSQCER